MISSPTMVSGEVFNIFGNGIMIKILTININLPLCHCVIVLLVKIPYVSEDPSNPYIR